MQKIIHQIWVGAFQMPDREVKFVEKLKQMNPFYELERDNFRHYALYSWSPENRKNFESGNINYLK